MPSLVPWLLFAHLLGVMVGLGPTFIFGRVAAMGRAERAASFTTRMTHAISHAYVLPLGAVVILSGFGLIWSLGLDVTTRGWLLVSIVLQLSVFTYSAVFQNRDISRILRLLDGIEPGTPPAPEVAATLARLGRRIGRTGVAMKVTTLVILYLMVVKPF